MKTTQEQNQPEGTRQQQGVFNKVRGLLSKILGKKKKEQNSIYPLR